MAEPVRKITTSLPERERPAHELLEAEPGITLLRWVKGSGGELEQVAMPLTPELFLNAQLEDRLAQGKRHSDTARQIADLLEHFFRPADDVLVTLDMLHRFPKRWAAQCRRRKTT